MKDTIKLTDAARMNIFKIQRIAAALHAANQGSLAVIVLFTSAFAQAAQRVASPQPAGAALLVVRPSIEFIRRARHYRMTTCEQRLLKQEADTKSEMKNGQIHIHVDVCHTVPRYQSTFELLCSKVSPLWSRRRPPTR